MPSHIRQSSVLPLQSLSMPSLQRSAPSARQRQSCSSSSRAMPQTQLSPAGQSLRFAQPGWVQMRSSSPTFKQRPDLQSLDPPQLEKASLLPCSGKTFCCGALDSSQADSQSTRTSAKLRRQSRKGACLVSLPAAARLLQTAHLSGDDKTGPGRRPNNLRSRCSLGRCRRVKRTGLNSCSRRRCRKTTKSTGHDRRAPCTHKRSTGCSKSREIPVHSLLKVQPEAVLQVPELRRLQEVDTPAQLKVGAGPPPSGLDSLRRRAGHRSRVRSARDRRLERDHHRPPTGP